MPTPAEYDAFASNGCCDESLVTENGRILMPCWRVLVWCSHCEHSWWTSQRSIVRRAARELGIDMPAPPRLEVEPY